MSDRRLSLHDALCGVLNCPNQGKECRAYFQPPSTVEMKYPAIVYALNNVKNTHANDGAYLSERQYVITLIDRDPDSGFVEKLLRLKTCRFSRCYTKDNLNHYIFEIFF